MEWIDKYKELPPLSEILDVSIDVLVTDGKNMGHGSYCYDRKEWTYYMVGMCESDGNEITHWAYLPKLP